MTNRHGYFTGAGYSFGAYREPSPERLAFLALLRSHRPPDPAGPFRLVELGCGQGLHLCLQAANYPQARFLGIDFHAEHIAHARSLAAAGGLANVSFLQADFLDLEVSPPEAIPWGEADLVVAHGILGWVSPHVGACLLRLAERVLRPGGLFYLSYNTLPGWLAAHPFQHTVRSLQSQGSDGLPALQAARQLFDELRQAEAQLFEAQPGLARRLDGLGALDSSYLLHEYGHSHWQPQYANQVIDQALQLGFTYLGSASLAENFDGVLPPAYRRVLQQQSDPALRELMRDLLTNQAFRRDVYAKGIDPLWPRDALAAFDQLRVSSLLDQQAIDEEGAFRFRLNFGEIQGNREWFLALMERLGDQPRSLAELREQLPSRPALPELLQNLTLLLSRDAVVLVPPERDAGPCQRFNAHLAACVTAGAPYRSLACPLSGNVRALSDLEFLALHALRQEGPHADLQAAIDAGLRSLGRQMQRNGQPLTDDERRAEIGQLSERFRQRILPQLYRLRVL
jgi:SAM-dependent methyltransferase